MATGPQKMRRRRSIKIQLSVKAKKVANQLFLERNGNGGISAKGLTAKIIIINNKTTTTAQGHIS